MFTIVDLEQGSPQWARWRHDGLGASDAPALMGENPWRSVEMLFAEKVRPPRIWDARPRRAGPAPLLDLFGAPPPPRRDTSLEGRARARFCADHGLACLPLCTQSIARPWQRASLDGIDTTAARALEIKCGPATYAEVAATGRVPRHYVGQLQQTLAVTGFAAIDFWVWRPGRPPLHLTVARDEAYIARLNDRGAVLWARVVAARPAGDRGAPASA